MMVVLGLAFACIVVGIVMIWGSSATRMPPLLTTVVSWVGVILVVVGLVLLLAPVVVFLDRQIRAALAGAG